MQEQGHQARAWCGAELPPAAAACRAYPDAHSASPCEAPVCLDAAAPALGEQRGVVAAGSQAEELRCNDRLVHALTATMASATLLTYQKRACVS